MSSKVTREAYWKRILSVMLSLRTYSCTFYKKELRFLITLVNS